MPTVWFVLVVLAAGCVRSTVVTCGDSVCAPGRECGPDGHTCAAPVQIEVCTAMPDGHDCHYPGQVSGVCAGGICIDAGCGNGILEPGELCDDGNRVSLDGCRGDCQSLETCGDGIVEPALGELCDCGTATAAGTCTMPNSMEPGATCRPGCTPARCGDHVQDPDELCDDGNTTSGDGCRADCLGRFAKMPSPTGFDLHAVWSSGPNDAYAVASSVVLHFDGTAWSTVAGTWDNAGVVWGRGPSDVYVGGTALSRFDGSSWVTVPGVTSPVNAIWGPDATTLYVATADALLVDTGAGLQPVAACHEAGSQNISVGGTSRDDVYATWVSGLVCHFDGATWTTYYPGGFFTHLYGAGTTTYAIKDQEVWVVGPTSASALEPSALIFASGILRTAADELLVFGSGGNVRGFDGTSWHSYLTSTDQALSAATGTDPEHVFIVGDGGTILH